MSDRICLIVDDEPAIRTFLRAILDQRQFHILEADSATHALKIIQTLGGRLDVILSDINMPGDMSGLDLAHSVRNAFPAIPVILISGYCDREPHNIVSSRRRTFVCSALIDVPPRQPSKSAIQSVSPSKNL